MCRTKDREGCGKGDVMRVFLARCEFKKISHVCGEGC